jgi:signal transduction histidine kinase
VESVVPGPFRIRRGVLGATLITVMVLAFAVSAVRRYLRPDSSQAPPSVEQSWLALVLVAVAVLVVVAGWIASLERPQVAIGLAIMSFGWLAPAWSVSPALPVRARVALLAVSPAMISGLHWLLMHDVSNGSANRRANRRSVAVVWILTSCAIVIPILGYNPFGDPSCVATCSDSRPPLAEWLTTRQAVALSTVFVLAAAIAVGFHLRQMRHTLLTRTYAVALAAVASAFVVRATAWSRDWRSDVETALTTFAILLVAASVLAAAVVTRRTRHAVEELVARLSASEPGPAPSAGAQAVLFALPGEDRWINAVGADARDPTVLRRGVAIEGGTIWLNLPEGGAESFAELAPATRLALRNARLTALGKARLAEVQASRLRILSASDLERKRIERDLHDGAQQRLVSASFHLKLALAHVDAAATKSVSEADSRVSTALDQLRSLAHGVYPSALTDEGLGAALEDLVATANVPTTLEVQLRGDRDSDVSLTAYGLVADYLAAATRSSVRSPVKVAAHDGDGRLTVTLASGLDLLSDLGDTTDRIGAIGGSVATGQVAGEIVVTAVIPCES